jgi:hypothetical protein
MTEPPFDYPLGKPTESNYGNTVGELEALTAELQAVSETKVYIGDKPFDGLATDTLLNLGEWQ